MKNQAISANVHLLHVTDTQVGPTTYRCVEIWDNNDWEKAYTMLINLMLLVLPIILMSAAYGCVCYTLWIGIKLEAQSERGKCAVIAGRAW